MGRACAGRSAGLATGGDGGGDASPRAVQRKSWDYNGGSGGAVAAAVVAAHTV